MKRRTFLSFVAVAAFLGLCTLVNAQDKPADVKPAKILFYSRTPGFPHGPANARLKDGTTVAGRVLNAYFADKGKKIEITECRDGNVFEDAASLDKYDGFIFCTVANLLGGKDDRNTTANGFGPTDNPMTEKGLRNLVAAVQSGKGLVGWHNATDTFSNVKDEDGKDIYTKLIGARFIVHGAEQTASVTTVDAGNFPFLKDNKEITVWEEWYAMKNYNKDLHVLQVQKTKKDDDSWAMNGDMYHRAPFPTTWIRLEGKGRVAYTSFGHSEHYFEENNPRDVERWGKAEVNVPRVAQLIEWSLGRFDSDTTPNIDKVAPGAGEKNDREYEK